MYDVLIGALGIVLVASFLLAPRVRTIDGFFKGFSENGKSPSLLTLILSQVTTWVFARSLMNAAILGFYYGIAGTIAYAAYYLSFLTGAWIIDGIRFRHGYSSVQDFLYDRFGRQGSSAYNVVVAVRLLSEVFANLLVVGIIFGVAGTVPYTIAIVSIAVLTLGYSMMGGLSASLRTDVLQTVILISVLVVLLVRANGGEGFEILAMMNTSPDMTSPGWILLGVAFLQIWSYPLHDPVMMDRGFIADRRTTRLSFLHACWISVLCILAFGLLGVYAGVMKTGGEDMIRTLTRLMGDGTMMLFNIALIISAISTLDSTFSSASKLTVVDMKMGDITAKNGRISMVLFLLGGLVFLFLGSKDLFSAVAVSGTASMFLAPVVFFSIWLNRDVAGWAFSVAFVAAMSGATLYFLEAGGHVDLIEPLFGLSHKYAKLLLISGTVMGVGCGAFFMALKPRFVNVRAED
ncbi:MAG: sodium:proline symporter [Rhodospirillaceae bacterium]|nr:MAG: sodium:proline symporter [Rhodospirillaceae bacterium]